MQAIEYNDQQSFKEFFTTLIDDARTALSAMPKWEQGFYIFWLLGPFILLIERSPADFWLSTIALTFLVRACINGDFSWARRFWVQAVIVFWLVLLISAALSADKIYALGEAFVWIRFPLFAMAVTFWLTRGPSLLYLMLLSTAAGLIIMCFILVAELSFATEIGTRLSWPYGDVVPGNYLAKVGLPVFVVLSALALSVHRTLALKLGMILLAILVMLFLTGERINFLNGICGSLLAGLVWKPKWKRYFLMVGAVVAALIVIMVSVPKLAHRYIFKFIDQLPTGDHSIYYNTIKPGIVVFQESPIWGIGTANFRNLCPELVQNSTLLDCNNHPHNFYAQLLGETGIVGLIAGTVMMWSIIWVCFKACLYNRGNVLSVTAFIVPFAFFWPVASHYDFFGQWGNVFMWSGISLALAASHMGDSLSSDRKSHKGIN